MKQSVPVDQSCLSHFPSKDGALHSSFSAHAADRKATGSEQPEDLVKDMSGAPSSVFAPTWDMSCSEVPTTPHIEPPALRPLPG